MKNKINKLYKIDGIDIIALKQNKIDAAYIETGNVNLSKNINYFLINIIKSQYFKALIPYVFEFYNIIIVSK